MSEAPAPSEMVDRLTRVVCASTGCAESVELCCYCSGEGGHEKRASCQTAARNMLKALSDPTPQMIAAMDACSDLVGKGEANTAAVRAVEYRLAWKAGIAAALKPPTP